jgi:TctA family transporter
LPTYKKGIGHGVLGFIIGFTPGAGLTLASNLSASIEKQRNPHKLLSYASAAEAANNSAAISCLIPFLLLGLPITPSEILIEQFLSSKFYTLDLNTINHALNISGTAFNFVAVLVACVVICNFACFILCGNFIRLWRSFLTVDLRWYLLAVKILIVFSIGAVIYIGNMNLATAAFNVVLFGALGVWADKTNRNVIGLAVMMMLGPFMIEKFAMAYYMFF